MDTRDTEIIARAAFAEIAKQFPSLQMAARRTNDLVIPNRTPTACSINSLVIPTRERSETGGICFCALSPPA
jgi:hypothetical protein